MTGALDEGTQPAHGDSTARGTSQPFFLFPSEFLLVLPIGKPNQKTEAEKGSMCVIQVCELQGPVQGGEQTWMDNRSTCSMVYNERVLIIVCVCVCTG